MNNTAKPQLSLAPPFDSELIKLHPFHFYDSLCNPFGYDSYSISKIANSIGTGLRITS